MATLAQTAPEEITIRRRVEEEVIPPAGVRLKSLFFDVDFAGDPAVYVVYTVSKKLGLGTARIKLLQALQRSVTEVLQEILPDRLVYTRFLDVR